MASLGIPLGLASLVLFGLAGCSNWFSPQPRLVDDVGEAGSVHLTITSVEPWDSVAPLLEPNFQITGTSAFAQALPNTANAANAVVQALTGELQVAAQMSTPANSSPATPAAPAAPAAPTAATLAQAAGTPPALGQDPMLQYLTAQGLFEEVTLLNREVQKAARRYGYRPYLVRFKVDMVPFSRDEPYDVYTDISFFTLRSGDDVDRYYAGLKTAPQPPIIVPLLVTDNIVGTHTSASADNITQLGANIAALLHSVSAGANLQHVIDVLRSITGTSLDSVETIARETDNTVRVRMGAVLSPDFPDKTYVMQARSHNVTLLLLVPAGWDLSNQRRSLHVVAQTHLRNSSTGKKLPEYDVSRVSQKLMKIFHNDLEGYWNQAVSTEDAPTIGAWAVSRFHRLAERDHCPDFSSSGKVLDEDTGKDRVKVEFTGYLYDRVTYNDQPCFIAALLEFGLSLDYYEYTWQDLAGLGVTYGQADAMLELPPHPDPAAPPTQHVLLTDDGKSTATGELAGGRDLPAADHLLVSFKPNNPTAPVVYATTVTVANGKDLQFTFPTLQSLCPAPKKPQASATPASAKRSKATTDAINTLTADETSLRKDLDTFQKYFNQFKRAKTSADLAAQLDQLVSPLYSALEVDVSEQAVPAGADDLARQLASLLTKLADENHQQYTNDLSALNGALIEFASASSSPFLVHAAKPGDICGAVTITERPDPWLTPQDDLPIKFDASYPVSIGGPLATPQPGMGDGFTIASALTQIVTTGTNEPIVRVVLTVTDPSITSLQVAASGGEIVACGVPPTLPPAPPSSSCVPAGTAVPNWTGASFANGTIVATPQAQAVAPGGSIALKLAIDLQMRDLTPGQKLQLSAKAMKTDKTTTDEATQSIDLVPPRPGLRGTQGD
jgi:hypothetical protein